MSVPIVGRQWQHPLTPFKTMGLAGTLVAMKTTPGTLFSLTAINTSGATAFIQIFNAPRTGTALDTATGNTTSAPTLGSTVPDSELQVASGAQASLTLPIAGQGFSCAITIASTTTEGGATGSASGVQVFANYA